MSTPEIRGNVDRAEPSPEEPTPVRTRPAPAAPDAGVPRGRVQLGRVGTPGALARLARLVPGVAARIGAGQADAYEVAAREAFHSAVILGSAEPLAPAALAPATAPAAKPEPTASRAQLAPPATAPLGPAPLAAAAQHAAPAIAPAISAAAEPPAERAAAAGLAEPPAPPRRRQPGETAPDFLLRTPTSVTPVADDFFDSLIRRVEGDR